MWAVGVIMAEFYLRLEPMRCVMFAVVFDHAYAQDYDWSPGVPYKLNINLINDTNAGGPFSREQATSISCSGTDLPATLG